MVRLQVVVSEFLKLDDFIGKVKERKVLMVRQDQDG